MRRRIVVGALAICCAWGSGARADDVDARSPGLMEVLSPSVSLRGAYWSEDKRSTADQNFVEGSAWLTLRPQEFLGTRSAFDGYVSGEDLTRNSNAHVEIREAYLDRAFGPVDVRMGRQVIVWGRADKLNPTDSIGVKNLKRLMTDDEDQRLGLFAASFTYNLGDFRLSLVSVPEWRSPVFPVVPLAGITLSDQTPDHPERQFGVKWDRSGGDVDYSVSYFRGISKIPDLKLVSSGANGTELALVYHRVQVLGGDFATSVGSWGLRGESAWTITEDPQGLDPLTQNSTLVSVFGVERSLIENLSLNAQVLNRIVFNYSDPSELSNAAVRTLAISAATNSQQLNQVNHGLSLRPNWKLMNETLELELAWVRWFSSHDQILRPKATYAVSDRLKAILGAELYSGKADAYLGRLKDNSSVFGELRVGL